MCVTGIWNQFKKSMFKKYALAAVLTVGAFISYSQNVGIGVDRPGSRLSVKGGISIGETYAEKPAPDGVILIEKSMGIGTDTPSNKLDVKGAAVVGTTYAANATAAPADLARFFQSRRATQRGSHTAAGRPVWPSPADARTVPPQASHPSGLYMTYSGLPKP